MVFLSTFKSCNTTSAPPTGLHPAYLVKTAVTIAELSCFGARQMVRDKIQCSTQAGVHFCWCHDRHEAYILLSILHDVCMPPHSYWERSHRLTFYQSCTVWPPQRHSSCRLLRLEACWHWMQKASCQQQGVVKMPTNGLNMPPQLTCCCSQHQGSINLSHMLWWHRRNTVGQRRSQDQHHCYLAA